MFFLDGKGQNSLSNHEQVMIGQHKSIEVVKIHWFCNSSLLLKKKIRHKTAIFPVLGKLTHMVIPQLTVKLESGQHGANVLQHVEMAQKQETEM